MIANFIIDTIIFVLDNTILRILPIELSAFPLANFQAIFTSISSTFQGTFNVVNNFLDIKLLFILLSVIILAEILMHFGFKSVKYVINVFRGSGG